MTGQTHGDPGIPISGTRVAPRPQGPQPVPSSTGGMISDCTRGLTYQGRILV